MTIKRTLLICDGSSCKTKQKINLINLFKKAIESKGLSKSVDIVKTGCFVGIDAKWMKKNCANTCGDSPDDNVDHYDFYSKYPDCGPHILNQR